MAGHEVGQHPPVAVVAMHDREPAVSGDRRRVALVPGVRELVEHGDALDVEVVATGQQRPDIVRADEPGAARDEDHHELICTSLLSPSTIRCARCTVVAASSRTCRPISEPSMRDSPSITESASTIEYAISLERTTQRSAIDVNGPM